MEPRFGLVIGDPWIAGASRNAQACVLEIGEVRVQVQLIDGRHHAKWPTTEAVIEQRYSGVAEVKLCTYTALSFVGAKTSAWVERTRQAPRDLYDLWALAQRGFINAEAAQQFRQFGPTGGYPERWLLPKRPPAEQQWQDALQHQCIPQVDAAEAFDTVTHAWSVAVDAARGNGRVLGA